MVSVSKVTVYRLEDAHGQGIYHSNAPHTVQVRYGSVKEFAERSYMEILEPLASESSPRHPGPNDDPLLKLPLVNRCQIRFGFSTLTQYRQWMWKKAWRVGLTEMGILLNMYEVPGEYATKGEKQAIFVKEHATLIRTLLPSLIG